MNFETFKATLQSVVPVGTVLQNPGGGTSEILTVSDEVISYRRGNSIIYVSLQNLFDAYWNFRGRAMSSTELRIFRPSVFDSSARPAGHSCNCTFLFLVLQRLGVVNAIEGKGISGNPFFVNVNGSN